VVTWSAGPGRYKPFPVIGAATTAGALLLLSRLSAETSPRGRLSLHADAGAGRRHADADPHSRCAGRVDDHLGTATSGVSLYSANGGSLGVALFGTIFNHRFATEIAHLPPAGSPIPSLAEIGGLPPSLASRDPRAA
jgi:hypothetical protein